MKYFLTNHDISNWNDIVSLLSELGVPEPTIMIDTKVLKAPNYDNDLSPELSTALLLMRQLCIRRELPEGADPRPYIDLPDDKAMEFKLSKP